MSENHKLKKTIGLFCLFLLVSVSLVSYFEYAHEKKLAEDISTAKVKIKQEINNVSNMVDSILSQKDSVHSVKKENINRNISYLSHAKESAPLGRFNALYFNTRLQQLLAESVVQSIKIDYAYSDLYNTPSEDFGAYWVGKMDFPKDTNRVININVSRGLAQLLVDDQLVFQGNDSTKIPYLFKKGNHLIEVQYFNNWHTTDFSIDFNHPSSEMPFKLPIIQERSSYSQSSLPTKKSIFHIGEISKEYDLNPPKLILIGVYKPTESTDSEISVVLDKVPSPIILVLSAGNPVKWNIKDPSQNEIVKIIYASKTVVSIEASRVIPMESQSVESLYSYQSGELGCNCSDGYFNCGDLPLLPLINKVQIDTNTLVYGYSIEHEASIILAPKMLVDQNLIKLNTQLTEFQKMKNECLSTVSPSFEAMVDSE